MWEIKSRIMLLLCMDGNNRMADFDDITGWEEELFALKQTNRWIKREARAVFPPGKETRSAYDYMPKWHVSEVKALAAMLLKQECLHETFREIHAKDEAIKKNPDLSEWHPDYPPRPHWEMQYLENIATWYLLKKDLPYNTRALYAGIGGAIGVFNNQFKNLEDPELLARWQKTSVRGILFK